MSSPALAGLLCRPDIWRGDALGRGAAGSVASGFAALDAALPGGGWPAGVLTEIFPAHEGIGELRLLGPALAGVSRRATLAWIAPPHLPYAPGIAAAGIDLARLVIVRTRCAQDALWAAEQALASNACGAVLAWIAGAKYAGLRRLQIAAEGGRTLAFLFRTEGAAAASPAPLRLALGTAGGGLAVQVLKRRGPPLAQPILLPPLPPAVRARHPNAHVDRPAPAASSARNLPARILHA